MGFRTTSTESPRGRGDRIASVIVFPLAVILTLMVVTFFGLNRTTVVEGDSMYPNLLHRDRTLVTRGYDFPRRGDVVVIDAEQYALDESYFVKRLIALPGDEIEVVDGVAYVNGVRESGYSTIGYDGSGHSMASYPLSVVPDGHVFVLGDNRPVSLDSRSIGPIPLSLIIGKATWIFAPVDRLGAID